MVVMSQITGPAPRRPGPALSLIAARRGWYRRPGLIIAVVLVVIAAVATALFLVLKPVTITASGTALDRLTGQPVASARVHAGGKSARTNARGVFRMPGLAPGARLLVQAHYYATARMSAASAPLRVRLAPIPVHVTATSALTGRPLAARVSPPGGSPVQAHADGTATLYLTGPGQALTARAGGYRPARAVIGQDHTATPTQPTMRRQLRAWAGSGNYQAIADWVLRPATGYYPLPGALFNQGGGDPLIAHITTEYIGSADVSVSIFTARPTVHWDTPNTPIIVTGASLHPMMLAGHRAWHGPDNGRRFETWWSYDPVTVITTGSSQASADAVMTMTTIIQAMTGTGPGR
jgi:hypothetical protein